MFILYLYYILNDSPNKRRFRSPGVVVGGLLSVTAHLSNTHRHFRLAIDISRKRHIVCGELELKNKNQTYTWIADYGFIFNNSLGDDDGRRMTTTTDDGRRLRTTDDETTGTKRIHSVASSGGKLLSYATIQFKTYTGEPNPVIGL